MKRRTGRTGRRGRRGRVRRRRRMRRRRRRRGSARKKRGTYAQHMALVFTSLHKTHYSSLVSSVFHLHRESGRLIPSPWRQACGAGIMSLKVCTRVTYDVRPPSDTSSSEHHISNPVGLILVGTRPAVISEPCSLSDIS